MQRGREAELGGEGLNREGEGLSMEGREGRKAEQGGGGGGLSMKGRSWMRGRRLSMLSPYLDPRRIPPPSLPQRLPPRRAWS